MQAVIGSITAQEVMKVSTYLYFIVGIYNVHEGIYISLEWHLNFRCG